MTETTSPAEHMRRVSVEKIETELDNMWQQANADAQASGAPAASRNSVLTLVIYAQGAKEARRLVGVIESLGSMHPSRAIVLDPESSSDGDPLVAYIATHTFESRGVVSHAEEILLRARSSAVDHLPGLVLPLIVSGLPSYLWWTREPPWRSTSFEAMVDGFDRLVIDTSDMDHSAGSLVALDDLMYRKKSSVAISDLNWTRQAPWRDLVAQFFDGPTERAYLAGIDRVTIEYAAGNEADEPNVAGAYLFAGWLASRLGWQSETMQYSDVTYATSQHTLTSGTAGHPVILNLNARFGTPLRSWQEIAPEQSRATGPLASHALPPVVGPGALMSVHLHAVNDGGEATFTVAREADLQHASTLCQVPGSATPSQTVHLASIGEAALLADQLRLLGHDVVFEEALTTAAMLNGPRPRMRGPGRALPR